MSTTHRPCLPTMSRECIDCGKPTENAQWIGYEYLPLCFACEEERERAAQLQARMPAGPAGQIAGWDVPADPVIDGEATP